VTAKPVIPVAAGCLISERGDVLIAQRPAGKIAAGKWEFPGGKIEADETPRGALHRELREELGIGVREARPLIRLRHEYPDRIVILDTWVVNRYDGELHPHDSQALAWVARDELTRWDLLAADRPIVNALRLPADYAFTPDHADEARIVAQIDRLPAGALLRPRLPQLDDRAYAALARPLIAHAREAGCKVIVDRAPQLAIDVGADGWHATSQMLALLRDPPDLPLWKIASCHSSAELARAKALGFDAAVLGAVKATSTHPDASPLGWNGFEALASEAGLPVYAIGGLGPRDRDDAFAHYAQGVAGISAYW
jgi:8-oxo-dGTP diphosphatase